MLHCYYEMYLMKYSLLWNNISYETERIIKILYEYRVKQFNRQCEKQEESIHFLSRIREAVPSISPIKECSRLVCCCSVAKSCPTLCDPMDCSPSGSSVHGIFPGKNTGVGCCFLLLGIFLTQRSNPWTHVSWTAGRFFTAEPPEKPRNSVYCLLFITEEIRAQKRLSGFLLLTSSRTKNPNEFS